MAGKQSIKCSKCSCFFQDTRAYIPYAVIGIFIVLAATFTSVYLMKMDSEVAETIYTTEKSDPRQTAISLAASDLAGNDDVIIAMFKGDGSEPGGRG